MGFNILYYVVILKGVVTWTLIRHRVCRMFPPNKNSFPLTVFPYDIEPTSEGWC